MNWIRVKISFSLIGTALLCLKGSRSTCRKPCDIKDIDDDIKDIDDDIKDTDDDIKHIYDDIKDTDDDIKHIDDDI